MKKFIATLSIIGISLTANAETAVTIYSKAQPGAIPADAYRPVAGHNNYYNYNVPGYAVVRETRDVHLPKNRTVLKYKDVAAKLDPTTVQFKSITDPEGTKVNEQNYQFDLVNRQKLLQKYIDKKITLERNIGDTVETIEGTLLSTDGGITLRTNDGQIMAVNSYNDIKFSELPGGLITQPTLVWDISSKKPGKHKTEVSYQTNGITWWADYNLIFKPNAKDENKGTVDFGSWVSILNKSGGAYNNAKLKLMAGDVQRVQPQQVNYGYAKARPMAMEMADGGAPSFSEKAFFEYHLYTLSQPATIPDNSTKQLELIPQAADVPVEKLLVYVGSQIPFYGGYYTDRNYGTQGNKKIDVYLKIENKKEKGLGKPLPSGRIRVNQRDVADNSLEFIGEDVIDHTARNEDLMIKLGSAFDVVGERKQLDYKYDSPRKTIEEEYEIKIRNQKEKNSVKVLVKESMYRAANWRIIESTHSYKKDNSNSMNFNVDVPAEGEEVIKYKVKYWW